ncbi:hypothetical protein TWF694_003756 [Orbilia ellipsospora]|uniref:C2H2-type domain-containing protein n=1 Tax=Orbilia ellipsospora TaxID=2528407 RepID=A0AAV9WZ33_9PEZI
MAGHSFSMEYLDTNFLESNFADDNLDITSIPQYSNKSSSRSSSKPRITTRNLTQKLSALTMEAPLDFSQIQLGNDFFQYNPLLDSTMSQNNWPSAVSSNFDYLLDFDSFDQAFTATQTESPVTLATNAINSPEIKPTSSLKRSRNRSQKSMLFLNKETGLLSPNLTGFTPSTVATQSPPARSSPPHSTASSNPSSPAAHRELQQQDSSRPSSSHPHPQPYVCEHCKTAFRFSRDYWQHKAQVHNDFRYRCPLGCGKGFARKDNLKQHHHESKRHRRSDSPSLDDLEELSRAKKVRTASSSFSAADLDEAPLPSPRTSSFAESSSTSRIGSESSGTPREADNEVLSHPEYLRLQREFELLNARYELLRREVHTLSEEKREWQARESVRRFSSRSAREL